MQAHILACKICTAGGAHKLLSFIGPTICPTSPRTLDVRHCLVRFSLSLRVALSKCIEHQVPVVPIVRKDTTGICRCAFLLDLCGGISGIGVSPRIPEIPEIKISFGDVEVRRLRTKGNIHVAVGKHTHGTHDARRLTTRHMVTWCNATWQHIWQHVNMSTCQGNMTITTPSVSPFT